MSDDNDDDYLRELPKIFEEDEKFGKDTTESISKMVLTIVRKKSDVKEIVKALKIPSNC